MFDLNKLYAGHRIGTVNPLCEGCSILDKDKPCHSVMDYKDLEEAHTLFLSDSIKYRHGAPWAFSKPEMDLINECYKDKFVTAASVKCPSVGEADMSPKNMNLCRVHLDATIDKIKPKLIFACGNLALKMLLKKSGITNKRGKAFTFSTESGFTCVVVPIYHPYSCIKEPRHLALFKTDIQNAYEKYILGKRSSEKFAYTTLMHMEYVDALAEKLESSEDILGIDIETTGLNFLTDEIMTIAISAEDQTWVIPVNHKDSPFKNDPMLIENLKKILENPRSTKVLHNAKFDIKFLKNKGIHPVNIWDTKVMHHFLDENMPKSLMDLAKYYFADELENL